MHGNIHGANADPKVYQAPDAAAMPLLDESRANIQKLPLIRSYRFQLPNKLPPPL